MWFRIAISERRQLRSNFRAIRFVARWYSSATVAFGVERSLLEDEWMNIDGHRRISDRTPMVRSRRQFGLKSLLGTIATIAIAISVLFLQNRAHQRFVTMCQRSIMSAGAVLSDSNSTIPVAVLRGSESAPLIIDGSLAISLMGLKNVWIIQLERC